MPRHHHITSVLKSLHWLTIPEHIHLKVLSLTYNSLQYSQPTYLCDLFTIQPNRFTRSSSCLTQGFLIPFTSHLSFSNRVISITAPRLWNDQPTELRTLSLPPPSLLQITKHHLHPAPLSVSLGLSTWNCSSISSKTLTLTHLILFLPTLRLNYARPNAYSLPSPTLWQSDLSFPRTILWKIPLIWRSTRE